jgi:hypothetical protein
MNYKEMKYVKTFCNIHQSKCSGRSEVRVKKEGLPKDYNEQGAPLMGIPRLGYYLST